MLPDAWIKMGGERCDDCSTCIASEFAFAQAYPETVDAIFDEHWSTWFSKMDVTRFVRAGINTVRIPLGYWIVEPLVDRETEFFAKGGIHQLRRGLQQLRDAGITVILAHHALPGVQAQQQMFAGRCTRDLQFYTPHNYRRALIWSGVMTALSHLDPAFEAVASIQAVNEPLHDASRTPGYGDFQKNFVKVVRAVEFALGVPVNGTTPLSNFSSSRNATMSLMMASTTQRGRLDTEVLHVLAEIVPILTQVARQLDLNLDLDQKDLRRSVSTREPLVTNFMDVSWQYNNPPNPADAAIGPQSYDNHLYYSWGGVAANATEEAYMEHICNLDRVEQAAAVGNSPIFFGEWSLATQFAASDEFLVRWADAQKFSYSKSAGWIFWNFKIERNVTGDGAARQWSYLEGLERGYLTENPAELHNPDVCAPYIIHEEPVGSVAD